MHDPHEGAARPAGAPRARGWGRILGVVLLVLAAASPLVGQVVSEVSSVRWDAPLGSDYAGIENDVRAALRADLAVGASSRLGVRNLGPAGAYWAAPFYKTTGEGAGGLILAAWTANLVGIAAIVVMIRSAAGTAAALAAALALAVGLLRAGPASLSDFYNPAMTVPALLVSTVAFAALSTGRWRVLPVAAGAASIGVQLHLVAGPGLVVGSVLGLAGAVACSGRPPARPVIAALLVGAVLWAPTGIDQVAGTANATKLVEALIQGSGSADHQPMGDPGPSPTRPRRTAVAIQLVSLSGSSAASVGTLHGTSYGPPEPTPLRTALGAVGISAVLVAAYRHRRRSVFGWRLVVLSSLGALVTFAVAASFRRGFLYYYLAPLPAYGIAMGVGLALIATGPAFWRGPWRIVLVSVPLAAFVVALMTTTNRVTELIDSGAGGASHETLAEQIASVMPEGCERREVFLDAEPIQTADAWALIVAFDKLGVRTTVPEDMQVLVGPGHERTGREALTFVVPPLTEILAGPPSRLPSPRCG